MKALLSWLIPLVPLMPLGACGRAGFDEINPPDAAPPPPAPTLSCTGAPRFGVGLDVKQLAATATADGYAVVASDSAGNVTATAYQFATQPAAALQPNGTTTKIDTNATGALGAYSHDGDVFVTVTTTNAGQDGTDAIDLSGQLTPLNPNEFVAGVHAQSGMGAYNAEGTGTYLAQADDGSVTGALSLNNSTTLAAPVSMLDKTINANQPTIVAAGAQFTLIWGSQETIFAQVFDDQLAPAAALQTISIDPAGQAENARAAYAEAAGLYLFVWTGKDPNDNDSDGVWYSLRRPDLSEITHQKVTSQGVWPSVAAGNDSFLVAWENGQNPYKLGAARVSFTTGLSTPVGVPDTGGTTAGWDMVALNGQAAVVWAEANGTGPNLWLDPLCQ